jgi:hypothetical protein
MAGHSPIRGLVGIVRSWLHAELVAFRILHHGDVVIALDYRGAQGDQALDFLALLVSARRSTWTLLGAHFVPRPPRNQMFGPPQPGASTWARSLVDSSSTSDTSAAAQKRATRRASAQSKVRFLMNDGMLLPVTTSAHDLWQLAPYSAVRPGQT